MTKVTLASINVNGIRAAVRKGFNQWLDKQEIDFLTLQEVRAPTQDLCRLLPDWEIVSDECSLAGRAGVAVAARSQPLAYKTEFGPDELDASGRWIEADYAVRDKVLTVASCYVFAGEANTVKQEQKMAFLSALESRLGQTSSTPTVITGDLNIGHRKLDIKNWRGNLKKSGFLPEERACLDRIIGAEDDPQYNQKAWIDVIRRLAGDVEGPYTWWSMRGQAFDRNVGWRIDYHLASAGLGFNAYRIDKHPSYAERWSDHAPVLVDYDL